MREGKGLSIYVLIGAIMFGLLVGATVIFGAELIGILMPYNEESFLLLGAIMFGLFSVATAIFFISVSILVGWLIDTVKGRETNEGIVEEDPIPNPNPNPNCVLATDEDFSGTTNGSFKYIGSADCVKIPQVIKGVEVTSYQAMFRETSVSKVVSDNLNITDMTDMFYGSKVTELDLSSINTSNVTSMYGMFYNSKAKELDLSSFDTSKVTAMGRMFYRIQATEIKGLENFDTSKVTNMYRMFSRSKATELDLSSFDTSNVTSMYGMFSSSQATEIKGLENFNTSKVTDMGRMFSRIQATELDLSRFDTSNVTDMTDIFKYSQAKTVYARTQADADKYNATSFKPIGLQVIVKQ